MRARIDFLRLWSVGLLLLVGCQDKAEPGYQICEQLEKAGKLEEAREQCRRAATAAPTSPFGLKAIQKSDALTVKIDEIVPPVVTVAWCARLAVRLEPRLAAQAKQKMPNMNAAFVEQSIREHVQNMEYNCRQDAGKPTAGEWACWWNETYETIKDCDKLPK